MNHKHGNVLRKIEKALEVSRTWDASGASVSLGENEAYPPFDGNSVQEFQTRFVQAGGCFFHCTSREHGLSLIAQMISEKAWHKVLVCDPALQELQSIVPSGVIDSAWGAAEADSAVLIPHLLVARFGTVVVSASLPGGRQIAVAPERLVFFCSSPQLVDNLSDALRELTLKLSPPPSLLTFITGPSRTADIEKTLVIGAHGPKEVYVVFVDNVTND